MNIQQITRQIEQGVFPPVLLLYGEEGYLIDRIVNLILEKGVDPATRDFNLNLFNADSVEGEQVVQVVSSYPMMAERRVVILKGVQKFGKNDRERIRHYAEKPLESTCLVMTAGKIDKRTGFFKAVLKCAESVECKPLYEDKATDWIIQTFRKDDIAISLEGAAFLVEQTGTGLWNLHHEIEKVKAYTAGKPKLTLADIKGVVGYGRDYTVWDLTDQVALRKMEKALTILDRLLNAGQAPIGIIMDLAKRVQILLQMKVLLQTGTRRSNIHTALKLHPYRAKKLLEQESKFQLEELERNMEILMKADLFIKTGRMDPLPLLTLTVHQLISGRTLSKTIFDQ
jgi:DNA polymerase-3 subunit delta